LIVPVWAAAVVVASAKGLGADDGVAEALAVSAMVDYLLGAGLDEGKIGRALELEDPERQMSVEMRPT
jgi:hypothetical protein